MKRIPLYCLVLIAVFSFSVFSCELIPNNCGCGEPPPPPVGTMEANFQPNGWRSTSPKALISNGRLTLIGYDKSTIGFSIEGTTPGSYDINKDSENALFYIAPTANVDSAAYSSAYADTERWGHVEITEIDTQKKTITGSFGAGMTNGKKKMSMDGAFNKIPYTEEPHNTFNAEVNNSEFNPVIISARAMLGRVDANFFKENGETINLSLPSNISSGTYDLNEIYQAVYISGTAESYKTISGSISVTEHIRDLRKISGTFHFDGNSDLAEDGDVAITAAAFTVYY